MSPRQIWEVFYKEPKSNVVVEVEANCAASAADKRAEMIAYGGTHEGARLYVEDNEFRLHWNGERWTAVAS